MFFYGHALFYMENCEIFSIKKCKYATVVSVSSEYFLRTIKHEINRIVYVEDYGKETVLWSK